MIQEQILRGFSNLNEGDVLQGYNTLCNRLIKIGKVSTPAQGEKYVDETLTVLLDRFQKEIFKENYSEDNKDMVCRWSILNFFNKLNYDKSDLKKAVHDAKGIHSAMPRNSKLTLNR